ncbi:MAG: ABC transporter permease [Lachnospiraceae bacterium]|nr:ABC transporter permease [Lachnospiraceae bacterium]
MKKAFHIAKANLKKHKSAALSLFLILLTVSVLSTIGISIVFGVRKDYEANIDRLNGLHSAIIMSKDVYLTEYEDFIKSDSRVIEYNIGEVIYYYLFPFNYGGDVLHQIMILDADAGFTISAPPIDIRDSNIPRDRAVYLPLYAEQNLGFKTGDIFTMTHRNRPIELIVAGFFEATEYSAPNGIGLKIFVPGECFHELKNQLGSSVWITARFQNPYDSTVFNKDFRAYSDVDLFAIGEDSLVMDFSGGAENSIMPVMIISSILLVFVIIIILISLIVIRFRVTNGIDESMHTIGVLKASGYKSGQIIASYLLEYSIISLPAALFGILLALPLFSVIRQILASISATTWTLTANFPLALIFSIFISASLLLLVLLSCRRIHKIPPVEALRGGIATNSFRRNYFPLKKGLGNVHIRLGFKNMMAYAKQYLMIGAVLMASTYAIIIIAALYQNFVINNTALIQMTGIEIADIDIIVTRHTDADALALEMEKLDEVKKTAMLAPVHFSIEGTDMTGWCSDDFSLMETIRTHEGRFPRYDNEIAVTKLFADQIGKEIGDSVKVKTKGITQEYIISGFFSAASDGGRIGMMTLEGYRRLDPNYQRDNIKIYFNEGIRFDDFYGFIKANYGVVNVYQDDGDGRFSAAKARAEEKISNYLEFYGIDSVEYAVIYNSEIILSGSSRTYQIEQIVDIAEFISTQISGYADAVSIITMVVSVISLGIIALILTMVVRQIVRKRRYELGVMKAGGYTTKQLARQIAISFMPCVLFGITLGCITGTYTVNPAVTAMFASTGTYNANVYIYPLAAVIIGFLILLFTYMVINLSAKGIKHITVYELISE